MAGILTQDLEETVDFEKTPLTVEGCLGEFNDGQKALAIENLNVYDRDSVYNKTESDIKINESIQKAFDKYLNEEDPHGTLATARLEMEAFVRKDGSTPFIAPLSGVDPVKDFHLATKRFVTTILKDHINDYDPHNILPLVEDILELYVKSTEVYLKNLVYNKNEIEELSGKYIRKDGSTPFTKAQIGADPQIDSHLATKRYVDKIIYNHLIEVDPHGFISLLNKRLAAYAKVGNVYDKSQTYSRILLDSIIRSLVYDAAKDAILDHVNEYDPHNILTEVRKEKYIKQDGTIPFKLPLKGVDAVDPQDLVTLHLVEETVKNVKHIWKTSGPVETTVGFVEDNSDVPETMTLQEIMDAIFYGKNVSISGPEYVTIGFTGELTLCVHGSTGLILSAVLYQGEKLLYTFSKEDFENGCITVPSDIITEDSVFTFRVIYSNDTILEDQHAIHCSCPIFVGLLPKWKFGNVVTMEYLNELALEDPKNNRFVEGIPTTIIQNFEFKDPKLRHPFIVTPISYPELDTMVTKSLSFGLEAFDIIDMIPLQIPGIEKDIIYKIYIYRQALSSLNLEITFNFVPKNEPIL